MNSQHPLNVLRRTVARLIADGNPVVTEQRAKPDARYSIALEYCGYAKRRWIVRFCGEWIGTGKNRADADDIARQHKAARLMALQH